tara:strand:+ start:440 stop:1177 length:738 start_codon:yes stop_codon:yes gene_type:complete
MAGHSKWANIKHKKAAQDAKKGKVFTKIIKELTIVSRDGGSDPDSNPRLRQAISLAKSANMPNDTIERAIKKGAGELDGINYEEILYEGYGPGGIAIIMNALTDNRNRTVAEIRHLMNKYGGNLGEAGSVSWMFRHKGQIIIDATSINEDTFIENVIDLEIEDLQTQKLEFTILTKPSDLFQIVDQIEKKGYPIKSSTLEYIAKSYVKIEGNMVDKAITLMDCLDSHDDVQNIYSNLEFEEQVLN